MIERMWAVVMATGDEEHVVSVAGLAGPTPLLTDDVDVVGSLRERAVELVVADPARRLRLVELEVVSAEDIKPPAPGRAERLEQSGYL